MFSLSDDCVTFHPSFGPNLVWGFLVSVVSVSSEVGGRDLIKQRSKLTFSKSRLLATFNNYCKMVALKKFWSAKKVTNNCNIQGAIWSSTKLSDTFANLSFAKLPRLLACQLKHCSNGQDKEKEEISMSGSRNDLLQSCWGRVTNRRWHTKSFKSIKILISRDDLLNN